jgi:hypothetical protein
MIAMASRDIWVIIEAVSAGVGMGFMGDYEAQKRGGFHAVLGQKRRGLCPLGL